MIPKKSEADAFCIWLHEYLAGRDSLELHQVVRIKERLKRVFVQDQILLTDNEFPDNHIAD